MSDFIELARQFRRLTNVDLDDPDHLAELNNVVPSASLGWPELLKEQRVLLLATAGSGKTWELREQARRLTASGKYAFLSRWSRSIRKSCEKS
jgi:hypothetical protein